MSIAARGWHHFPRDPALAHWIDGIRDAALATAGDPDLSRRWTRAGGTWFAGVNALANDATGRVGSGQVGSGPALAGAAIAFARAQMPAIAGLDRGQVSICYPGYPRQDPGESDAAFRYRHRRDGAHLDGLHPIGPERRRHLMEYHSFILGLPITDAGPDAAPLVVWEGSHRIMGRVLRQCLADVPPGDWGGVDLTDPYQAARKQVFETCPRRVLAARPGEATVLHRFLLHGMAPWSGGRGARAIVYFRPPVAQLDARFLMI